MNAPIAKTDAEITQEFIAPIEKNLTDYINFLETKLNKYFLDRDRMPPTDLSSNDGKKNYNELNFIKRLTNTHIGSTNKEAPELEQDAARYLQQIKTAYIILLSMIEGKSDKYSPTTDVEKWLDAMQERLPAKGFTPANPKEQMAAFSRNYPALKDQLTISPDSLKGMMNSMFRRTEKKDLLDNLDALVAKYDAIAPAANQLSKSSL